MNRRKPGGRANRGGGSVRRFEAARVLARWSGGEPAKDTVRGRATPRAQRRGKGWQWRRAEAYRETRSPAPRSKSHRRRHVRGLESFDRPRLAPMPDRCGKFQSPPADRRQRRRRPSTPRSVPESAPSARSERPAKMSAAVAASTHQFRSPSPNHQAPAQSRARASSAIGSGWIAIAL